MTTVAVIIPTMGRPDVLPRALASIEKQTRKPDVVMIAGDGVGNMVWASCVQITTDFMARSRIKIFIHNMDKSYKDFGATPRNWAISNCDSELIAYLDDDDAWVPEFLETSVFMIEEGADVTHSGYFVHLPLCGKIVPVIPSDEPKLGIFTTSSMVHRRKSLDLLKRDGKWWKSQDCHDYILISGMLEGGAIIRAIKEPLLHYYISKDRYSVIPDENFEGVNYCKVEVVDCNKDPL